MQAVKQKGFTLIEVCLVMLIFGVAVSSLMALFPVSLRQGSQAVSDSVVSAFGDSVMNSLAGVASSMQSEADWATWKLEKSFKAAIIKGVRVDTSGESPKGDQKGQIRVGIEDKIEDYLGLGKKANNSKSGRINIRYKLDIVPVTRPDDYHNRLYRAILYVTDNPSLDLSYGTVFVTYLAYLGEVP